MRTGGAQINSLSARKRGVGWWCCFDHSLPQSCLLCLIPAPLCLPAASPEATPSELYPCYHHYNLISMEQIRKKLEGKIVSGPSAWVAVAQDTD